MPRLESTDKAIAQLGLERRLWSNATSTESLSMAFLVLPNIGSLHASRLTGSTSHGLHTNGVSSFRPWSKLECFIWPHWDIGQPL